MGMCRFTTKLFNSPNLPGLEDFSTQIAHATGLSLSAKELRQCGLNITGLERMVNHALGARKRDDTLPRRWFEEELEWGAFKGEKISRNEFDRMLARFYALSGFDEEGQPRVDIRRRLAAVAAGFAVTVKIPRSIRDVPEGTVLVTRPIANVRELIEHLERMLPGVGEAMRSDAFNLAVNGEVLLHGEAERALRSGDQVELVAAMAGG
jgi:aldehyde:ferredoxin oxidoreductase